MPEDVMSPQIRIIYGVPMAVSVGKEFLAVLDEFNVKDLDTGASYPGSEKAIGQAGLPGKYLIHTKARGWQPGAASHEGVLASAAQSFINLETDSTYYLHTPDPATPLSETLAAIQKLYEEGRFKHFGISNFLPADVQNVYDHCCSKNYVLPTVYEGNYNPVGRHAETELFPLLRKLKIRFYAYGALAGGFLTKTPEYMASSPNDLRWNKDTRVGQLYQSLYNKPRLIEALSIWDDISRDAGISKSDLAYRWVAYHSALDPEFGDGMVLGVSRPEQLRQTLDGLRDGPLSKEVAEKIARVWDSVKDEAIMDNFNKENKG